ncbi:hypothetical protein [Pedobacter antarcticus]|uniref:hypothetical protein n=1 Tax=Pedobacter antarcticus TaxID=34086 RepID=UPI00293159CA|nr:hypothetical protein [Pedobacter antarcticus]
MQSLKKAFRLLCLLVLIILASFGIGLSSGIVIPVSRKREDNTITTELVESNNEDTDSQNEQKT